MRGVGVRVFAEPDDLIHRLVRQVDPSDPEHVGAFTDQDSELKSVVTVVQVLRDTNDTKPTESDIGSIRKRANT